MPPLIAVRWPPFTRSILLLFANSRRRADPSWDPRLWAMTVRPHGWPISVMPSGMGMPSASIYITELVRSYGVTRLIRVGTAGVYAPDLQLRQIVAAEAAVTNSNIPAIIGAPTQPDTTNADASEAKPASPKLQKCTKACLLLFGETSRSS